MSRTAAPEAPGRLGEAIPAPDLLRYLSALETWLDERRTELDRLDAAAQAAATPDASSAQATCSAQWPRPCRKPRKVPVKKRRWWPCRWTAAPP